MADDEDPVIADAIAKLDAEDAGVARERILERWRSLSKVVAQPWTRIGRSVYATSEIASAKNRAAAS